jgi:hypothetical protein
MCRLCSLSNHFPTKYVHILYIKSSTVYVPSSELGLSQPLSRHRVCPSPQNRGGGTLACGRGVGGVPIPTTGEKAKHSVHFPVRLLPSLSNLKPVCLSACLVYLLICLFASLLIFKQYTPFTACLSGSVHQLNCQQACLLVFILYNCHLPVCIFAPFSCLPYKIVFVLAFKSR